MALSCRCSVLSRLSDDLAPAALTFFNATFDGDWPTLGLGRRRSFDCRHDSSRSTISVASGRNQRMAALLGSEPGFRHRHRQRGNSIHAPPLHLSHSGVCCRSRRRLSRQLGIVSRRLRRSRRRSRVKIRLVCIDGDRVAHRSRACLAAHSNLQNEHPANRSSDRVTCSYPAFGAATSSRKRDTQVIPIAQPVTLAAICS